MNLKTLKSELQALRDPVIAEHSQRFFKTAPGEYGEGDRFLGIRVPVLRQLAKRYQDATPAQLESLLHTKLHEQRLLSLIMMVNLYRRADDGIRQEIYNLYLTNTVYINNWDLVDTSAPHIVGAYLYKRSRQPLYALAKSNNLWERRIAILATHYYIRRKEYADSLAIAKLLLHDNHDLIHKAVGWTLREAAKRNDELIYGFLDQYASTMPRTMLRYAIEKFPVRQKSHYMTLTK